MRSSNFQDGALLGEDGRVCEWLLKNISWMIKFSFLTGSSFRLINAIVSLVNEWMKLTTHKVGAYMFRSFSPKALTLYSNVQGLRRKDMPDWQINFPLNISESKREQI